MWTWPPHPAFHLLVCQSLCHLEGQCWKPMSSCAIELVCGFRTIIGLGGSSGMWKMRRKYVSWHNTLRSEPLFPSPLYFQSKEVTSVHAPHAWDATETQPVGLAPLWKGPVSQLCPEARSLGYRRAITSLSPCETASRPTARRNRNWEGHCCSPQSPSGF